MTEQWQSLIRKQQSELPNTLFIYLMHDTSYNVKGEIN